MNKILLVDDDRELTSLLKELLEIVHQLHTGTTRMQYPLEDVP